MAMYALVYTESLPLPKNIHVENLVGRTFSRLHVLANTGKTNSRKEVLWQCQCSCGNPETLEVPTPMLVRGLKKSCGCLKGRKVGVDHNNRDCREAVLLALYWARIWKQEITIHFGHRKALYVLHRKRQDLQGKGHR